MPDCQTHDTQALKKVLASLSATGGTFIVPAGTYLVSTALSQASPVIRSNTTLQGTNAVFKAADAGYQFSSTCSAAISASAASPSTATAWRAAASPSMPAPAT